jgi:hypothetical protein
MPATRARILRAGLCASCVHVQLVTSSRGSEFYLCRRSLTDPEHYPRYPALPVVQCAGYEAATPPSPRPANDDA